MKALRLLAHIPGLKSRLRRFIDTREESIRKVDSQIAALHAQRKSTFYLSLFIEFAVRVAGCLEIQFILLILTDHVSFWDCVLIQAFTSLLPICFSLFRWGWARVKAVSRWLWADFPWPAHTVFTPV